MTMAGAAAGRPIRALVPFIASTTNNRTMTFIDEYEQNKDRPAWLQANADQLSELTGVELPRSRAAIDSWLETKQAALTRKVRDAFGEYDDEDDGDSGGGE